jgi:hypothetical protein
MTRHETFNNLGTECFSMPQGTANYVTSDSKGLTPQLREALKMVERSIEHMNQALRHAAEAGAVIEVRRAARAHSEDGCWADQMEPLVLPKAQS